MYLGTPRSRWLGYWPPGTRLCMYFCMYLSILCITAHRSPGIATQGSNCARSRRTCSSPPSIIYPVHRILFCLLQGLLAHTSQICSTPSTWSYTVHTRFEPEGGRPNALPCLLAAVGVGHGLGLPGFASPPTCKDIHPQSARLAQDTPCAAGTHHWHQAIQAASILKSTVLLLG
jgi:hypothetical protein